MSGTFSSFFAVGATTGIPGYFLSAPVLSEAEVIGVIVVKIEPRELPALWRETDSDTVITDELGVIILATRAPLLYTANHTVGSAEQALIAQQRRYPLNQNQSIAIADNNDWKVTTGQTSKRQVTTFVSISTNLQREPWQLTLLYPRQKLYWRAALLTVSYTHLTLPTILLV